VYYEEPTSHSVDIEKYRTQPAPARRDDDRGKSLRPAVSQSRREADAPAGKKQAGWKEAAVVAMMRVAIACRGSLGRHSLAGSVLLGRPRLLGRRASGKAGAGAGGLADAEV
jgi:hypothetical protein